MRTHLFAVSRRPRLVLAAATLGAAGVSGCLRNPSADAATAQAITEISDHLGTIQQDAAAMQAQIDSLRMVLARQDTVLRRLANLAGVPMTR